MTRYQPTIAAAFQPQSDSIAVFGLSPEIAMMELPRGVAVELHRALAVALATPDLARRQADLFEAMKAEEADQRPDAASIKQALSHAQRHVQRAQEDEQSGNPALQGHAVLSCLRAGAHLQHAATLITQRAAEAAIAQEEPLP